MTFAPLSCGLIHWRLPPTSRMISILCTLAAKLLLEKCGAPSHSKTARHKNCCLWNGSIEPWNLQIGIGWRRTIASKPISKNSHTKKGGNFHVISAVKIYSAWRDLHMPFTLFFFSSFSCAMGFTTWFHRSLVLLQDLHPTQQRKGP